MTKHSTHSPFDPTLVPEPLRRLPQWVCWRVAHRRGMPTKVPVNPKTGANASTTESNTWASFEEALESCATNGYAGIGFVFTAADPFVGIDLDDCISEDGTVSAEAIDILRRLGSYSEISPSGRGIKCIIEGRKPEWAGCRTSRVTGMRQIEVYEIGRYFTITTNRLPHMAPSIRACQAELDSLCAELWSPGQRRKRSAGSAQIEGVGPLLLTGDRSPPPEKFGILIQTSIDFPLTWRRQRHDLRDQTPSGYDLALAYAALAAGWTDQEAVDLMIAWRREHRAPEKLREDYYRRTLAKAKASVAASGLDGSIGSAGAPVPEPEPEPSFEGPLGVTLTALEIGRTPRRLSVRFRIERDGELIARVVHGSDTAGGVKQALCGIVEVLEEKGTLVDQKSRLAMKNWVGGLLTTESLQAMREQLERRRAAIVQSEGGEGPLMRERVVEVTREIYDLRFQEPGQRGGQVLWSELEGRAISHGEFARAVHPLLLNQLASCRDYPEATEGDPSRDLRHVHLVLSLAWAAHLRMLPTEVKADDLGPTSKAAARCRRMLVDFWTVPETWIVTKDSEGRQHTERMSLASRVRNLPHASTRGWEPILRGVNAFYRRDRDLLWLALRYDALRTALKGLRFDALTDQESLIKLMTRYGLLAEGDDVPPLRDPRGKTPAIAVLSQEFTSHVIEFTDPEPAPREGLDNGIEP